MKKSDALDPLLLWLLAGWCRECRLDLDYVLRCRRGEEEMLESVATAIEEVSGGKVPISYWPRVKSAPTIVAPGGTRPARALPRKGSMEEEGAPTGRSGRKYKKDLPYYRFLAAKKRTASDDAEETFGISHQLMSLRLNGDRKAPLAFVQKMEKHTKEGSKDPAHWMTLKHWPVVYDEATGREWEYGKLVRGEAPQDRGGE